ncbi:MAG TPA: ankyrin repeat domain-containing protein [Chthoniobacterales bacterium]|nr:ankyrin repeat domain-containing protein [Chthoniobacterales bacterium]
MASAFAFLGMTGVGSAPEEITRVTAEQFVHAVTAHKSQILETFFTHSPNVNARAGQDRPILVSAILQGDKTVAKRLLEAGACVDLADESGLNALMAACLIGDTELVQQLVPLATNPAATDRKGRNALHYAIAAGKPEVVEILLPAFRDLLRPTKDDRNALSLAMEQENQQVLDLLFGYFPGEQEWSLETMRLLETALSAGNKEQVKLLLSKHCDPPVHAGKRVPLLAYEIAAGNVTATRTLLECGADANTLLPDKCDPDFLAMLPPKLRYYVDGDKGVTILTLAAGLGQCDMVRVLLDAGARKNLATTRYKMLPLYVAAQTGKWQCAQILLGGGPSPEELRVEITLASQRAAVFKNGVAVFDTICSTGRAGFATQTGDFVITDKNRSHISTIYKVAMPYFMRLSCLDFGMHEGAVPNYPASHGCIRLPGEAAKKLFAEIPVGTLVTVK